MSNLQKEVKLSMRDLEVITLSLDSLSRMRSGHNVSMEAHSLRNRLLGEISEMVEERG